MMIPRAADRRKRVRVPASGPIEIELAGPAPTTIPGELIDCSDVGFRAAHHSSSLAAGLEIRYRREGASGRARVVWTHVLDGNCVSGFLLL